MKKTIQTRRFRLVLTIIVEDREETKDGQVLTCKTKDYCSTSFGGNSRVAATVAQYNEAARAVREFRA